MIEVSGEGRTSSLTLWPSFLNVFVNCSQTWKKVFPGPWSHHEDDCISDWNVTLESLVTSAPMSNLNSSSVSCRYRSAVQALPSEEWTVPSKLSIGSSSLCVCLTDYIVYFLLWLTKWLIIMARNLFQNYALQ